MRSFAVRRPRIPSRLLPASACAFVLLTTACGGGGASPTGPSAVPTTPTGGTATGATTYTYTADIRPLLASDCTRCHSPSQHEAGFDFTTYAGVLRAVAPGDPQSLLVRATSQRGVMYPELSGDRAFKSQLIYDWVVNSRAAQ